MGAEQHEGRISGDGEHASPLPWPSPGVAVIALIGDPAGPSLMRPNDQRGGRGVAGHEVRTNLNSQLVRTALSCSIRCVRCNVQ